MQKNAEKKDEFCSNISDLYFKCEGIKSFKCLKIYVHNEKTYGSLIQSTITIMKEGEFALAL